jgi:ABC-type Zn uptake system ZnuABC Zn-binding protein ZnuA/ABC-type Mn2+/Zn2+ transport system permease subunit
VWRVFETFQLPFVQRGLVEVLLLALASGVLGTWVVLRGQAFFVHAVGTAAFPGLVLADGLGFAAPLGALMSGLAFAAVVSLLRGARRSGDDSTTAIVLAGALALGVILASDVFDSGSNVDSLLFGSLLLVGTRDIVVAAIAAVLVLAAGAVLHRHWLVRGFDPDTARALGAGSRVPDAVLLVLVAVTAIAALTAVGALLTSALLVVPAATTRLWLRRLGPWQLATGLLAAAEGVFGLWLSVELNAPPGATIALVGGVAFALAAAVRLLPVRVIAPAAGAAVLLMLAGCGREYSAHRVAVLASTTQVADLVRAVGGDTVVLRQVLKPNSDPHDYEPRPDDVRVAANAAILFESGRGLDSWMGRVVKESGAKGYVIDLGAALPQQITTVDGTKRVADPHWWHDPRNAIAAANQIGVDLANLVPSRKPYLQKRLDAYVAKLDRLDDGIRRCIARIPLGQRKLVTDHDALGYFARRYGLTVVGAVIPSQTTHAQASARDVARLVQTIKREHVKAVFPESSVNADLAKAIAKRTGASSKHVLYGDSLGPKGSRGETYIGMELANADAITRGLTGGRLGCTIQGLS